MNPTAVLADRYFYNFDLFRWRARTSLVWCKIFEMLMQNGDNNRGGDVQDCGYVNLCKCWTQDISDGNLYWWSQNLYMWKCAVGLKILVCVKLFWGLCIAVLLVPRYSRCSTISRPNLLSHIHILKIMAGPQILVLSSSVLLISGRYRSFLSSGWRTPNTNGWLRTNMRNKTGTILWDRLTLLTNNS